MRAKPKAANEAALTKERAALGAPEGRRRGSAKWRIVAMNVASLGVALLIWQVATVKAQSPYFPGPTEILRVFIQLVEKGDILGNSLLTHIWASVYRLLVGFGLGVLLGVPLGLLMGLYKGLYTNMRAVIEPFRFIPPIAWIPLAIILFSGLTRYAFLIFLGAFFPIFTAALVGVARVEPIHRKVALVYGASKSYVLRRIVVPTVMPDILGGMRVGLGTAWMTIVAAELTGGAPTGLGRMMVNYSELLRIPEVVVAMILIGALGFLFNEILLMTEKYLFRWRWEVTL